MKWSNRFYFRKKPKKDGKNKNTIESDEVKEENNGELELLLANENPQESDRRHFNMKKILKADTLDRKKKKSNETEEADKQQFGVDVKDKRFEAIFSSHLYNIDPSEPQFKRTKGMEKLIEEKHKRLAKGNVQQQKVGNPSEKLSSTHTLPDVDRLVKSVKQKTSNWQSRKKQKV